MKPVDTELLLQEIAVTLARTGPVRLMEVCGTHTVALFRSGVRSLLPKDLHLISGPGCPVCVTSQGYIDAASAAARRDGFVVCTYGDMVRVPGQGGSLAEHRAQGANVLVVYSACDALAYAVAHPEVKVVFLAVGFETTAPATAAVVKEAKARQVRNFFVFLGHKLVIPAMRALLASGDAAIDGFLCPGHVSVIIGADAYKVIAREHRRPCVIAGFEPAQLIQGIHNLVVQVARREARVANVYSAAVTAGGNRVALGYIADVFRPGPAAWRALGMIPGSGLELRDEYAEFDAERQLGLTIGPDYEPPGCRCGQVIQGKCTPAECPLFRTVCTVATPIGPCMVSSEGTCAAWYKYGAPSGGRT